MSPDETTGEAPSARAPEKPWFVVRVGAESLWFAVAVAALFSARHFGRTFGLHYLDLGTSTYLAYFAWLASLVVAVLATWRLARRGAYATLLLLAAAGLVLAAPGRAGDVSTWRTEWAVFGLLWLGVALVLFLRLFLQQDELQRLMHLEGAGLGLTVAIAAATGYALFEPYLPVLRAQWVAGALLVSWWCGWFLASRRYQ